MNRVLAIVAALSVPTIAAVTASPLSTGARAASVPSWVPAGAKIYCDFSDDKCWDGYTSSVVAPTSLLQLVRQQGATSVGEIYTDASRTPAMISSGNLAIGSAGLQIMAQTNYLSNSTITIGTTLSHCWVGPLQNGRLASANRDCDYDRRRPGRHSPGFHYSFPRGYQSKASVAD